MRRIIANNRQLLGGVSKNEKENDKILSSLNAAKKSLDDKQRSVKQLESDENNRLKRINALQVTEEKLFTSIENKKTKISELEIKIIESTALLEDQESAYKKTKLAQEKELASAYLSTKKDNDRMLKTQEQVIEKLSASVKALEDKITDYKSDLSEEQKELDVIEAAKIKLEKELSEIKSQIKSEKESLINLEDRFSFVSEEFKTKEAKLKLLDQDLTGAQQKLTDTKLEILKEENKLTELKKGVSELEIRELNNARERAKLEETKKILREKAKKLGINIIIE